MCLVRCLLLAVWCATCIADATELYPPRRSSTCLCGAWGKSSGSNYGHGSLMQAQCSVCAAAVRPVLTAMKPHPADFANAALKAPGNLRAALLYVAALASWMYNGGN
mmetsp:Transcript_36615/g.82912  ORF Transcript_36615/g.82912 Transcript_36615/m.82912 type:complete len:107 (-) Transcript_36615:136-456(-)